MYLCMYVRVCMCERERGGEVEFIINRIIYIYKEKKRKETKAQKKGG